MATVGVKKLNTTIITKKLFYKIGLCIRSYCDYSDFCKCMISLMMTSYIHEGISRSAEQILRVTQLHDQ